MYVEACEATHVRGEQSAEVLDLRMACLAENLDDLKALTRVLSDADVTATAHAVTAVQGLPDVKRCSDVAVLRARTPLPRDQRRRESVQRLRTSMKEVEALRDVADFQTALSKATVLRPQIEAVGYGPLLAESWN